MNDYLFITRFAFRSYFFNLFPSLKGELKKSSSLPLGLEVKDEDTYPIFYSFFLNAQWVFLYSLISGIMIVTSSCIAQQKVSDNKWEMLFDGNNLDQWYTFLAKPNPNSVVKGMKKDKDGNYLKPIGLNKDPIMVV